MFRVDSLFGGVFFGLGKLARVARRMGRFWERGSGPCVVGFAVRRDDCRRACYWMTWVSCCCDRADAQCAT
jgi:hypothetical protein